MKIDFEGMAQMAAARLREELSASDKDTKRAKELSSILKDIMALCREQGSFERQTLLVEFKGKAEEDSK